MKSLIGIAASLAACVALWWTLAGNNDSLYAQMIKAARKARTIHIVHCQQLNGQAEPVKTSETWYESGVGFRRDVCDWKDKDGRCATICGHGDEVWTLDKERKHTLVQPRKGITKETDRIFADFDRHAADLRNNGRRYPEGDQTLDGQPCSAYLSKSDKWRQLYYLDQRSRLVRVVSQERNGDRWNTTQFSTIGYDEPLDSALFQPNSGKVSEILGADTKRVKPGPTKPEGPVLVYEVDPSSKLAGTTVDMDKLVRVVDLRLNGGAEALTTVRKLDDRRIEVALMRRNDADRQRVERQLTRPGTLEFRLLANKKVDKALIDRAQKEPTGTELLDPSGKRLAWWVPVKAGEEKSFSAPEIAQRPKKKGKGEEILVVADPYNVTGAYLAEAKLEFDRRANPAVSFTFNDAGGELFGKLTGEHLPNDATNFFYKLGIIIDGELVSAPAVRSQIGKKGEITGSFTEIEVSDLAAVLSAGSLPARLRLVEAHPQP